MRCTTPGTGIKVNHAMQKPPARIWAWEESVFGNYWAASAGEAGTEYIHAERVEALLRAGDAFLEALRAPRDAPGRDIIQDAYKSFAKAMEDVRAITSGEARLALQEQLRAKEAHERETKSQAARQLAEERKTELRRSRTRGIIIGVIAGALIAVAVTFSLR